MRSKKNAKADRRRLRPEVESLARDLIDQVRAFTTSSSEGALVMDIEVDGVRILLMEQHDVRSNVSLSPREREISHLVAKGLSNKRIAAALGISSDTVSTHLRRIFAKLGVTTRSAMVAYLLQEEFQGSREP